MPARMWRRVESELVRLAYATLVDATARARTEPVSSRELRMALRVLWLYIPRRSALTDYWLEVSSPERLAWNRGDIPLGWIEESLVREGWDVTGEHHPCEGWAMCNRYRMTESQAALARRYGVEPPYPPDLSVPPGDLFPKRPAFVIVSGPRGRQFEAMDWGWPRTLPGKRGAPIQTQVTNVRNLDSPMWRATLAKPGQRCLVPFTAFSEYGPGEKGKRPLYWFDVPSQPIASFAGIYRPDGRRYVFAFLTCEPNALVEPIHPKAMPLILHQKDEQRWLDGELGDLVAPFPSQLMTVNQD